MPKINIQELTFYYETSAVEVFNKLTLNIDCSWKTGLVGNNGRGKTTLLALINKYLTPVCGSIKTPLKTKYFPYHPVIQTKSTFDVIKASVAPFEKWEQRMDNLLADPNEANLASYGKIQLKYEKAGGYEIDSMIQKESFSAGLKERLLVRPFDSLSGGEQTRALIVSLFLDKKSFALIDEPTNHLDMDGRHQLAKYLSTKKGFIVVSHDRHFLDVCTDHIISINKCDVKINNGNYSKWKIQMGIEQEFELRKEENLQREIKQLTRAAKQKRVWSGKRETMKHKGSQGNSGFESGKATKLMKRALAFEKRIIKNLEEKELLLGNREKKYKLKIQDGKRTPEILLKMDEVSIKFDERVIINNFSLRVCKGDIIAIVGSNGSGKTTLVNAICGKLKIDSGAMWIPGHVTIRRSHQLPIWTKGLLRDLLLEQQWDETRFREILGAFGVSGSIFDRPLETFSLGEQKKVDLCRCLFLPAHLYIWDEPLNYIDLMSREQIEELILHYKPTLILIEHDQRFVEKVAKDILSFPFAL